MGIFCVWTMNVYIYMYGRWKYISYYDNQIFFYDKNINKMRISSFLGRALRSLINPFTLLINIKLLIL